MGKPFLLQLSSVLVQQRDLLKLGMVIDSYNDHCSAPFSRACWLAYAPPTLLGSGSRHCHGINFANYSILHLTGSSYKAHPQLVRRQLCRCHVQDRLRTQQLEREVVDANCLWGTVPLVA